MISHQLALHSLSILNFNFYLCYLNQYNQVLNYLVDRKLFIETGKLARQADGAVTVRQGNCIILATVVASKEPKEGQDWFPLTVDYKEKFASAGRIPGSFFKREGRLNDYEIFYQPFN